MSAYVIFIRESTIDQSELDAYAKEVRPILEGLPIIVASSWRVYELEGAIRSFATDANSGPQNL
jgi:hypothetical protein